MPGISSLLAVLTPFERENFLPGKLFAAVEALSPEFQLIDPSGLSHEAFAAELRRINPEVVLACWQTPPLPAELPPRLRYMCYLTGSVRRLVTRTQLEQGFLVTNWGSVISRTVAECALMHTLACLRHTTRWTFLIHQEQGWRDDWEQVRSLFNRRVGVHGYGAVAREFLKLIQPFNCTVSVLAPDFDATAAQQSGATPAASLEALFAENDVIIELAPLNPVTAGTVTESHLRLIRPGGVFVNVARAGITDEDALLRIAREGNIQIGLDVFVQEPMPVDSPWRGLRNVSVTPHIAGPTLDRYPDAGMHALNNLRAYAGGQPLTGQVTPLAYDQAT
ncbi:MAG: hydroxyacid dehydrogenase [Cephaloticoccus sp.]|nr:hydroxyacid dehydrogenase [Cephaloticoccus sp.]MCF7761006.1 hydroxyacid dehydrogenase [Cephaloticoccus sp.]